MEKLDMLTVTTQYRGGGGALLKTPRSTSHTIYIGEAPEAGGSTEKPDGSDEFGRESVRIKIIYCVNNIDK